MSQPSPLSLSGTVLVCGSAECLGNDLFAARKFYPASPVIAVNGSAAHVRAQFLFSQHPLKLPRWIAAQRSRFGDRFTVHAAGEAHVTTKLGHKPAMPWVDHWWPQAATGGTSAWGARRMAHYLGFTEVILVGCPLLRGGYFGDDLASKANRDETTMSRYRGFVADDVAFHEGVKSMSGWTADFFGMPE